MAEYKTELVKFLSFALHFTKSNVKQNLDLKIFSKILLYKIQT